MATIAVALAGCGGDQSSTSNAQSPAAIVAASKRAAERYTSVLAAGVVPGTEIRVDLRILRGKGVVGHITDSPYSLEVVKIGENLYLKGHLNFYEQITSHKLATQLQEKWILTSANGPSLVRRMNAFTELRTLIDGFFDQRGKLSLEGTAGVEGMMTREVKNDATGEVLYIYTSGKPYPAQILRSGAIPVDGIAFDHWVAP